jgi:hypothetical protein
LTPIDLQPIRVRTGHQDGEGRLALADGELVAVLVRLDDPVHGDQRGRWFLEAGFGPCGGGPSSVIFEDLEEAESWLGTRLP